MNAETKFMWFQAGAVLGSIVTTLLFYIYFTTPKPIADSRPVEDSNIHIVNKKQATKRTADQSKRAS